MQILPQSGLQIHCISYQNSSMFLSGAGHTNLNMCMELQSVQNGWDFFPRNNKVEWWPHTKNYESYSNETVSVRRKQQARGLSYTTQRPTGAHSETW